MPGHGQFWDQISVKTYVGTGSFYCEMCPIKLGHAQFQKRDYPPASNYITLITLLLSLSLVPISVPKQKGGKR